MSGDASNVLTYLNSILEDPDWKKKDAFELAKIAKPDMEDKSVEHVRYYHRRAARRGNTTIFIKSVNIYHSN